MRDLDVNKSIGPLSKMDLRQYFTPQDSELSKIEVLVGTYMKENKGSLTVSLFDADTDEMLFTVSADSSKFKDNSYCAFDVPETRLEASNEYYLRFIYNGESDTDDLAMYRSAVGTATEAAYAMVNGDKEDYSLNVRLYGTVK